jgi:hypothetical protein
MGLHFVSAAIVMFLHRQIANADIRFFVTHPALAFMASL